MVGRDGNIPHASDQVLNLDLANNLVSMLRLQLLQLLTLDRDDLLQGLLQVLLLGRRKPPLVDACERGGTELLHGAEHQSAQDHLPTVHSPESGEQSKLTVFVPKALVQLRMQAVEAIVVDGL